MEVEIAVR